MTVFRYDKTFEGLLTAIFDAYARRTFPDALLAEGSQAPLFTTEEHTVVTDPEKSGRVWRALEARLPKEVCNMLFFGWLSEEPGVDMMLARYMRRVFDERGGIFTDFTDPDVLCLKQLAAKVSKERERLMQFTRFQKSSEGSGSRRGSETSEGGGNRDRGANTGSEESERENCGSHGAGATYFAPVSPRYNALPLAIPYFRDRFRDQRWLIYDIRRRYGFYYDLETVTEVTMDDDAHLLAGQLDEAMMAADEKLFQSLWKSYSESMAIAERINPRLQRQHMPRRFWPLLTEMR